MNTQQKKSKLLKFENGEVNTYCRILNRNVPGIAPAGTPFKLEGGYYINESETILLKSNEKTGPYFTLEKQNIETPGA